MHPNRTTPGCWQLALLISLSACQRSGFNDASGDNDGLPGALLAVDDAAQTWDSQSVDIPVLANDSTSHGVLSLVSVTQPTLGTAAVMGSQVRFTPIVDTAGEAVFTYTAEQGDERATATVRVTVRDGGLLGGTVSGLATGSIELDFADSSQHLDVISNGAFTFAQPIEAGTSWRVLATDAPTAPSYRCTVDCGEGVATGTDETGIVVSCLEPGQVLEIAAGGDSTCARLMGGQIKCWGDNGNGQLGQGDNAARGGRPGELGAALVAVDLGTGRSATALAMGQVHVCVLLDNDQVKCWGDNANGQLGLGDINARGDESNEMGDALPMVDLGAGYSVTALAAGGSHTCAILDTQEVKCWGENGSGQLGLGATGDRGDTSGDMGDNLGTVNLGASRTATAVALGEEHSCALLDNNTVKCWGENSSGQLGLGDQTDRGLDPGELGDALPTVELGSGRSAMAIAAHGDFTCALLDNNTVKCWGDNSSGQLGLGDQTDRGDAGLEMGDALAVVDLGLGRTATAIIAGRYHSCALLDNNQTKCWGSNSDGQLGLGDTRDRGDEPGELGASLASLDLGTGRSAQAIAAGGYHTCALLDNGEVKCWGDNECGQLGAGDCADRGAHPPEQPGALPAVALGTGRHAVAMALGFEHSCVLLDNDTLKCFGGNISGQLGLGDDLDRGNAPGELGDALPAVDLGTGRTVMQLAVGGWHQCVLLDNHELKCWGYNAWGQLGLEDNDSRADEADEMGDALPAVQLGTGRTALMVACGLNHTCAVLDNQDLKCWGYNNRGELGYGDNIQRGQSLGDMGDGLPVVDLGTGRTATTLALGGGHSCALLDNSQVKCWGGNDAGQLGYGDEVNRGDGAGEMGDVLPTVNLGTGRTVTAIAAGHYHNCALLDNGQVKCWGYNLYGQLGLGDDSDRGDASLEMGDNLPAVDLGVGRTASAIMASGMRSCARLDTGAVKCWGTNTFGELGLGDAQMRGDRPCAAGDWLWPVAVVDTVEATAVALGYNHSCALIAQELLCWGDGELGQLGTGSTAAAGRGQFGMGDALVAVDL